MIEPQKIEVCFDADVVEALTKMHDLFSIDIEEYIVEAVKDDIQCSHDFQNDTVLNRMIRANRDETLAILKEEA